MSSTVLTIECFLNIVLLIFYFSPLFSTSLYSFVSKLNEEQVVN